MSDKMRWHVTIIREIDGLEVKMEFDTTFELKGVFQAMYEHIGDGNPKRVIIESIGDGDDD